jgi:hypothetical protein
VTRDEEVEARAPCWCIEALRRIRDSFQLSTNGLDCETMARADEINGLFSVVVRMSARSTPSHGRRQVHEAQLRLDEYDLVRFGLQPFLYDRLRALLRELAVAVFECNTVFEPPRSTNQERAR